MTTAACGTSTWSRFLNEPVGLASNYRICLTLLQLEEDFDVVELSAHQRLQGRAQGINAILRGRLEDRESELQLTVSLCSRSSLSSRSFSALASMHLEENKEQQSTESTEPPWPAAHPRTRRGLGSSEQTARAPNARGSRPSH